MSIEISTQLGVSVLTFLGSALCVVMLIKAAGGSISDVFLSLLIFGSVVNIFSVLSRSFGVPSPLTAAVACVLLASGVEQVRRLTQSDVLADNGLGAVWRFTFPRECVAGVALFLATGLSAVASITYALDRTASSSALENETRLFVLTAVVLFAITSRRSLMIACRVYAIGIIGLAVAGLLTMFPMLPDVLHEVLVVPDASLAERGRISGTFGDPNSFARYMVLGIPLVLVFDCLSRTSLESVSWKSGFFLIAFSIVASESRTAMLFGPIVLILSCTVFWKMLPRSTVALLPVVGVLACTAFVFVGNLDRIERSVDDFSRVLQDGERPVDNATRGRLDEQRAALHAWKEKPWLGHGLGNFDIRYETYSHRFGLTLRSEARAAHNYYLELLAERGIVGLAIHVSFFGFLMGALIAKAARFVGERDVELAATCRALTLVIVAYLLFALFLHGTHASAFWVAVGLSLGALRLSALNDKAQFLAHAHTLRGPSFITTSQQQRGLTPDLDPVSR